MKTQLSYTEEEVLASHEYATKFKQGNKILHGGLDEQGQYQPPRSLNRIPAIAAWTEQIRAGGNVLDIMDRETLEANNQFFPSVEQTTILMRHGCKDALTRMLTVIGVIEGFGNDGIKLLPPMDFQPYFVESIEGTAIDHLHKGLLIAHGQDEAGSPAESGHDEMWFAIRDRALENPVVTDDMYENLPLAPPPGYAGKAKASQEATVVSSMELQFPQLEPAVELTFTALARILHVEYGAYTSFKWARELLADPEVSAAPEWAPRMVDFIQADEDIHVQYLRCALAEANARTFRTLDGGTIPGSEVIPKLVQSVCAAMGGERAERMKAYRYRHILDELADMPDGDEIHRKFKEAGPVPKLADSKAA